jgi:hypothetical protein
MSNDEDNVKYIERGGNKCVLFGDDLLLPAQP